MIQDIAPHIYDNRFTDRRDPEPEDCVLYGRNGREIFLAEEDGKLRFPTAAETGTAGLYYAFKIDGTAYFLGDDPPELPGFAFRNQQILRSGMPREAAFAGITGMQLLRWRSNMRFCGRCGAPMRESETERAYICTACGKTEYPKIMPCIITAVMHRGKVLVTRYADRPLTSWALVAGFCELGETAEETVHREVMEEVGLRVKNLRFYKSQPWSFTDTLLFGFFCELDGNDETVTLDRNELKEAVWLRPEELPERAGEASLTAEMMECFRTGKVTETERNAIC